MNDFVNREIKVLDVLTLTVLLEQGDVDYTMVEYWDCTNAWRPPEPKVKLNPHVYQWARLEPPEWKRQPPVLLSCCLSCLCKRFGVFSDGEDNKAPLIDAVKNHKVGITRAWLRTSLTQCTGCGHLPHKALNPTWLDFLKT